MNLAPQLQGSSHKASSIDQSFALGSYVGRYRIVAELGHGGMANVYLAVAQGPQGVQKLVVLKALRPVLADESEALSMFLDEARLAAQLNHANVVQTYEVGSEGGRHVIVMEYLEGQPLSAVVRRAASSGDAFPLRAYLRVVVSMLEGLQYAHDLAAYDGTPLKLVHRDVSPQNVFLTYDGQVKLLDFGIAKAATSQNHTAAGVIKGKLAYMAPEQMVASRIDRRTDVYSVGCILWAAAAGEKLWRSTQGVEIVRKVVGGDIPSPRTVNPLCDQDLERIVMKALACDPDRRYASALALQEDLEAFCERKAELAKQKEVGTFVSALFADTHAELKRATERELRLAAQTARPGMTSAVHDTIVDQAPLGRDEIATDLPEEDTEPPANRDKGLWFAAALLLVLAAAGFAARGRFSPGAQAAPHVPVRSAPLGPATSPVLVPLPALATLELRADPPSAQLSLDGVALQENPFTKVLAKDGTMHHLEATAPGYEPVVKEFAADQDGSVVISLSSTPPPKGSRRRAVVRLEAAPAPAASTAANTPAANAPQTSTRCDQPFFVNDQGIKVVRPECL